MEGSNNLREYGHPVRRSRRTQSFYWNREVPAILSVCSGSGSSAVTKFSAKQARKVATLTGDACDEQRKKRRVKTGEQSGWHQAVRCKGMVALATASSGVAAGLLPGGRTAHSRFKLPLQRLGESLDANIKSWATGKERNLCALLSTLQCLKGMEESPSSTIFDAKITGIRFGLPSSQEIYCKASIRDCSISHSSQLSNPFLGLPLEASRCESCETAEPGQCEGMKSLKNKSFS
ncbi:unnamed protein product [Fraxinus pennsylvanica]|uniref:ATP-dependent DNA helicase n=1 Tax=Fraxinus pennsylvanica TaxID=56036 RepID=A0AAD2A2R5_9LAMI|nr:unnamed protein product [Fraxinus pennsylvanica]